MIKNVEVGKADCMFLRDCLNAWIWETKMHRCRGQKGGGPKALLQVKVLVKPLELYPKKIDQRLVHHQHPTIETYEVWEWLFWYPPCATQPSIDMVSQAKEEVSVMNHMSWQPYNLKCTSPVLLDKATWTSEKRIPSPPIPEITCNKLGFQFPSYLALGSIANSQMKKFGSP